MSNINSESNIDFTAKCEEEEKRYREWKQEYEEPADEEYID